MAVAKKKSPPEKKPAARSKTGQQERDADVIIIGGGLAGLTFAAVLGHAGVRTVIIDREDPKKQLGAAYDGRTTAISFASHRVLQAAGVWDAMLEDSCPILDIRVADGGSPLYLHFDSVADGSGNPFGWIVENQQLRRVLMDEVRRIPAVTYLAPAVVESFSADDVCARVTLADGKSFTAALLVGADGRGSAVRTWLGIDVREKSYGQSAIVCNVAHEKNHDNVALEHFLPAGPFAALPMTQDADGSFRSSVVWTEHGDDASSILALPPPQFDAALQKLFGAQLGRVRAVTKPAAYPLRLMHARSYTGSRTALMAEAAHVIHPIAGQGLNLSMRDVAVLAELVVDRLRLGLDPGAAGVLRTYESWRRRDTRQMAVFTDALNRLFSNRLKTVAFLRDTGIGIVHQIPILKKFFARQAMGLGGKTPRIVQKGRI